MRIVIIMLALVIPASAHFPHDSVFEIFQFPDEHVPTMDGDSADWDVVPAEYFIDHTSYRETLHDSGNRHARSASHTSSRRLERPAESTLFYCRSIR